MCAPSGGGGYLASFFLFLLDKNVLFMFLTNVCDRIYSIQLSINMSARP